jgi:hypothetical protein
MWRLYVDGQINFASSKQFDPNGDVEGIGDPLSTSLDSNLLTALRPLNPFVGGNATFGNSQVHIQRSASVFTFQPAYGVTDRLSVGVIVRYYRIKNNVTANVDSSTANVGFSTIASPFGPAGSVVPIALVPGTRRATTQDIQNLLATQFGIQPVQTWEREGLGDTDVGARYQYYNGEYFRGAFTGGVRIPTGWTKDPNSLVDTASGGGAWAALFRFNQDFVFGGQGLTRRLGFPTPGTGFINTTFSYDLNLPSKQEVRVCSPILPLCSQKDVVTRTGGDHLQAEITGNVGVLMNGLIARASYVYQKQFDTHSTGDKGFDYGSLAIGSGFTSHEYIVGLTYTTIPLVVERRLTTPLSFTLGYRERFAGENALKAQSLLFTVQAFF